MPKIVSERQRRAFHAAAAGKSTLGISVATGKSAEDPGGKLPWSAPKRKTKTKEKRK